MPYRFTLTTVIPATAQDIYDTWLDSRGHSEMTGGKASMSTELDADVSAWDGYITGRNLELVPGERIVQSWRTREFPDDHEDSIITVTLVKADSGTLLTLVHANVPDGQTSYELGGWQEHYFEPMQEYFART
jgi:activator of HSP90 ATPase